MVGGKLEAKGVKQETSDADSDGPKPNECVSKVKVTVGGVRPPRLLLDNPKPQQIATFCHAYKSYEEQIEIANEDGEERTKACLRELVSKSVQTFVCFKWFRGKPRTQLTDELRIGLHRMAGIEAGNVQVRQFKNDLCIGS